MHSQLALRSIAWKTPVWPSLVGCWCNRFLASTGCPCQQQCLLLIFRLNPLKIREIKTKAVELLHNKIIVLTRKWRTTELPRRKYKSNHKIGNPKSESEFFQLTHTRAHTRAYPHAQQTHMQAYGTSRVVVVAVNKCKWRRSRSCDRKIKQKRKTGEEKWGWGKADGKVERRSAANTLRWLRDSRTPVKRQKPLVEPHFQLERHKKAIFW